ncbi:MAG: protein kinase [Myxococcales bacterium]|nr:protein kinase [Myxococcales bacterium]
MTEDVFGILGTTVAGAYHVEETVAEGGFGVVYRAYHTGFRAPVALKCLKIPQGLGAAGQELFLEQFRAEAELLFRLSASIPTVVRPLHVDALIAPGGAFVPFMALEWLEGETLEALVRRRKAEGRPPLSVKKLARLLTPVARALERAHNFSSAEGPISIVHRDLKPENIFLARVAGEDVVKILDFGIGKAKSVASQVAGRASQNNAGVASFTPAYGAPEQWLPKRYGQTGPWTDVWGLALTLVESLTARPVIDGDHAAMMGTALDEQRRPTPRNEGVIVSDEVEAVFQRALAVDPRHRYADAGLFWNDLLEVAGLPDLATGGLRRDARAEGFRFPQSEHLELERPSSTPPPSLSVDLGLEAQQTQQAPSPQPAPSQATEFPDLALPVPASSGPRQAAAKPARPLSLDLDLPEGERPAVRSPSGANWPAVSVDRPAASASGANWPAVSGGKSGSSGANWPAAEAGPASSRPDPVSARGSSQSGSRQAVSPSSMRSEALPPVSAIGRSSVSGQHPAVARALRVAPTSAEPTLRQRLMMPGLFVLAGIVLSIVHGFYASQTGEVLAVGPVRVGWIAGLLVVVGIALGVLRVTRPSS